MSTVVIDCETVSQELTNEQLAYLCKDCQRDSEHDEAVSKAALYPLTGKIICVGMLNPETTNYVMLTDVVMGGEKNLLADFWEKINKFSRVVTFNGRSFDIPYLLIRSAILGITISRHDLMGQRFSSHPHCDLLEQLSFYGATRRMSLAMYCDAFGIKNPKSGCDGSAVGKLYAEGRHQEIADYCADDLKATAELYRIWAKRMCR